ncbi:IgaA/UmoB family intracellular growth attenuator [Marivirga tractuosa]|uniref:IgaA/UmoB family intracellular growth attenuator n=1 Tax=Marivirga tractuosa TaxID=1006 RepID=UPI0035D01BB6
MNTLYIILVFAVLLYSLYNAITYTKRRNKDKKVAKQAINTLAYHRELTDKECKLLDAIQEQKGFKKTHKRIDNKVYLLKGTFNRHGIEVRHNEVWHNLIGGLEVVLDDRGLDFVQHENVAEVIKTDKIPVVLTLNNSFSLLNTIGSEKQLEKGEVGTMADGKVTLINSRKQTALEVQSVEKQWKGTIGAFLMIPAIFLMALTALWDVYSPYGAIPGGILFLLALYFLWRKPKYSKPQDVRTLKGVPEYSAVLDASENVQSVKAFMGTTELNFEKRYWLPFMVGNDDKDDTPVEVDVTTEGWLMRFGPYLSLEEEEKKIPSQPWYRHVIMTVIASVALIVGLFMAPELTNDIRHDAEHSIFRQLKLYAPAIFMALNLILLIIHAPLAYKSYNFNKQRKSDIQQHYINIFTAHQKE